jgi:hypothetical protein
MRLVKTPTLAGKAHKKFLLFFFVGDNTNECSISIFVKDNISNNREMVAQTFFNSKKLLNRKTFIRKYIIYS